MARTIPDVFIIESLEFKDEERNRFEGKFLSQILGFAGKKPLYYYIRTKKEFEEIIPIFQESQYRYLHISCHGNSEGLGTTLEFIPFKEFGRITQSCLDKRRLFVSACSAGNENLAKAVLPSSGCNSVIGPIKDIAFGDAAIFWASFYHLMFKIDKSKMKKEQLRMTLDKLEQTFGVRLDYYSTSKSLGYMKIPFRPKLGS